MSVVQQGIEPVSRHLSSNASDLQQALLSVFKGRLGDVRDKDTAVERCKCHIQDQPDKTECRLIVKMLCRHGVYVSLVDAGILITVAI